MSERWDKDRKDLGELHGVDLAARLRAEGENITEVTWANGFFHAGEGTALFFGLAADEICALVTDRADWIKRLGETERQCDALLAERDAARQREQRLREAVTSLLRFLADHGYVNEFKTTGLPFIAALDAALVAEPEQTQDEQRQGLGGSEAARSGGERG